VVKQNIKGKSMWRKIVSFTVIIFMVTVINSCKKGVEPEETNYHNKILFTSSRSGKAQLYMMNPDGTNIQQITSGEYSHSSGRWSPDASKIVCSTDENTTTADYSMMEIFNADGTNKKLLGPGSQMVWFPTGEKIFFTYCPSCEIGIFNAALYSVDPQGNNVTVVSHDFGGEITFSVDGKTIAYIYVDPDDSIPDPALKFIDYPALTNIRLVGPKGVMYPIWSPNGQEIAYSSQIDGTNDTGVLVYNIFIMDSSGTNERKITTHQTMEHYLFPRWSADGSQIIFTAYSIDGTQRKYLYMVNRDGTNLHKVIDDSTISSADWSK